MARFGLLTLLASAAAIVGVQAGGHTIDNGLVLRIMPLGASQTAGTDSTDGNGWRAFVRNYLQAYGNEVDYVGSQTQYGNIPSPNNACEAYPGATIGQLDAHARSDNAYATYKPNVIILTAGTNNCLQGPSANGPQYDASHQMGALLENIYQTLPNTLTLVAGVVPWLGDQNDACITGVNSGIQIAVNDQAAYGQKVEYVSLFYVLNKTTDYSGDGIHPNEAGYQKLALAWEAAVDQYGSQISPAM